MLLRHNLLVHHCIYGTVPFQSLTRSHTRIRSRSRTREKPLLDIFTSGPHASRLSARAPRFPSSPDVKIIIVHFWARALYLTLSMYDMWINIGLRHTKTMYR